ncbi:ER membrane complex subunit EMC3 [Rhodotorula paludigena]|uniref:ER membrane complex subunit EMC3 n=1 Tax=Rhodotorula paludigena TaxID=86838 RepID=UPI003181F524
MTRWNRAGLSDDLSLSPEIRLQVLVPLCAIVLFSGLVRHWLARAFNKPPKPQPLLVVREQRGITRAQILRANSSHLPPAAFVALRSHLSEALQDGSYLKKPPPAQGEAPPNPLENPQDMEQMMEGMSDMMKKQAVGFVPQMGTMWLVNRFFAGKLLARIPFPLPLRFKELLQRGIFLPDIKLDASWCSATSWYFLCMFGLGPVYSLLLGDNSANSMAAMSPMMGGMAGGALGPAGGAAPPPMPGAPGQDFVKLFRAERENLDLVEYAWVCDGVEERLLQRFGEEGTK